MNNLLANIPFNIVPGVNPATEEQNSNVLNTASNPATEEQNSNVSNTVSNTATEEQNSNVSNTVSNTAIDEQNNNVSNAASNTAIDEQNSNVSNTVSNTATEEQNNNVSNAASNTATEEQNNNVSNAASNPVVNDPLAILSTFNNKSSSSNNIKKTNAKDNKNSPSKKEVDYNGLGEYDIYFAGTFLETLPSSIEGLTVNNLDSYIRDIGVKHGYAISKNSQATTVALNTTFMTNPVDNIDRPFYTISIAKDGINTRAKG